MDYVLQKFGLTITNNQTQKHIYKMIQLIRLIWHNYKAKRARLREKKRQENIVTKTQIRNGIR